MGSTDTINQSSQLAKQRRGRNRVFVLVWGLLFGLLFASNLWLAGVEQAYERGASRATEGKVLLTIDNYSEVNADGSDAARPNRENMGEMVEAFGGTDLGEVRFFGKYGSVVVPADLVAPLIEANLDLAPVDSAPVIASGNLVEGLLAHNGLTTPYTIDHTDKNQEWLLGQTLTDDSGAKYYIAGFLPQDNVAVGLALPEMGNYSAINSTLNALGQMNTWTSLVLDNGQSENWQWGTAEVSPSGDIILASFESLGQAERYMWTGPSQFTSTAFPERKTQAKVLAGAGPETSLFVLGDNLVLVGVAAMVLLVMLVILICVMRAYIRQDQEWLASHTETAVEARRVFAAYVTKLMLGAIVVGFGLASAAVLGFSLIHQEALQQQAVALYGADAHQFVLWYGVNWWTLLLLAMMLLQLPIALGINWQKIGANSVKPRNKAKQNH